MGKFIVVSVKNDKIGICLDPNGLNKVIKREHHLMKSVEEVTRDIPNATMFSKRDAKSGFLKNQFGSRSLKTDYLQHST